MPRRLLSLFSVLTLPACLFAQKGAKGDTVPPIHLVLFTPAGVEPPGDAPQKLAAVAEYTEAFFVKWMKHWGYPPAREKIFPRGPDGKVRVLHVRGSKPPEEYKDSGLLNELWPAAHKAYNLPQNNPIWWVWVYKGDPPVRFSNYRGSGDLRRGGWAIVNYENRPGAISPRLEMAAGYHHAFTLKGCVHELGHALGLPHIGPRVTDRLGNTLMGPRTDPFRKAARVNEDRVYLSEAAAAMLWKHFVFPGTAKGRAVLPSVEVRDYRARHDRARGEIVVSGRLVSNGKAHSVVLTDDAPPNQEDYWRKAYVVRPGADGRFEVRVREPSGPSGTFRLMFCFENGAITGDGKTRELKSAFAKKYQFAGGAYRFEQ